MDGIRISSKDYVMIQDKNTLELISDITEFNDLHEFMKDEHLDRTLAEDSIKRVMLNGNSSL